MPTNTKSRPWRSWYDKKRWLDKARMQLRTYPLCAFCLDRGKVVPAEVADHITPHRGNYQLFWFGRLQSLCASCHNKTKKNIEDHGYDTEIGEDGWPIDRKHPVYDGGGMGEEDDDNSSKKEGGLS